MTSNLTKDEITAQWKDYETIDPEAVAAGIASGLPMKAKDIAKLQAKQIKQLHAQAAAPGMFFENVTRDVLGRFGVTAPDAVVTGGGSYGGSTYGTTPPPKPASAAEVEAFDNEVKAAILARFNVTPA